MTSAPRQKIACANRRLAAALVLVGLFLQMLAPYLPMPTMGGLTSWDVAWLDICSGRDNGDAGNSGVPHDVACAVCLATQQAAATLAPATPQIPVSHLVVQVALPMTQQAPHLVLAAAHFSSRAPPLLG